jgi:signal transduction histidine kinase
MQFAFATLVAKDSSSPLDKPSKKLTTFTRTQVAQADSLQERVLVLIKKNNDYATAIPLQLEVLRLWREANDSAGIARALDVLARGFAVVGDTARALVYAEESLKILDKKQKIRHYLSTIAWLVELGIMMGKPDSLIAARLLRADEYIRTHTSTDSSVIPAAIFVHKAEFALRQRRFRDAQQNFELSKRYYVAHKINMTTKGKFILQMQEKILQARIYAAERRYGAALQALSGVREDSANIGSVRDVSVLGWYAISAEVFAGLGKFDSAFAYQRLAQSVQEAIYNASRSQTLTNAQVQFDVQRKEERLAALELEKSLQSRTTALLIVGIALLGALLVLAAWAYRQRQQSEALLRERNSTLERLSAEKSEFLRVVAHDLKNPLLSVKMASEHIVQNIVQNIVQDAQSPHDALHLAVHRAVHSRAEAIARTSETMLNAVKLLLRAQEEAPDSDVWLNPPTTFDAVKCVNIILDDFAERAEYKKIVLDFQPTKPVMMLTLDEDAFYRIVENLVSNAVKFSPKNSTVVLQLEQPDSRCIIRISNDGKGISPKEQQYLFQPYSRLASTPTANEHSSGLGLSIVKRYVDALNGTVQCESSESSEHSGGDERGERGERTRGKTTFIVDIPSEQSRKTEKM